MHSTFKMGETKSVLLPCTHFSGAAVGDVDMHIGLALLDDAVAKSLDAWRETSPFPEMLKPISLAMF